MPKKAATARSEDADPQAAAKSAADISRRGHFRSRRAARKAPSGLRVPLSQLEMARLIEQAFQKHQHVVIEAGTGTGKTLAYLIPAIRSGRRVVISTATKSLQEQLFQKDVPFLQKHFAPNLKAALMKGRANFLCRQKVHQMDGPAGAEGDRRDRLVLPDPRLGEADGNGRPQRTDVSARRRRAVEPH